MPIKALGFASISAVLFVAPALAHHSFAIFDQSKTNYLSGEVKQFEWVNPHAWLHVTIVDGAGKTLTWSFEGGSPLQLAALGWKADGFHAGDKVEIREGRLIVNGRTIPVLTRDDLAKATLDVTDYKIEQKNIGIGSGQNTSIILFGW